MAKIINVAEISAAVRAASAVHFEVTKADVSPTAATEVTFKIPIKAGTFVHHVATAVTTAFNKGGGAETLFSVGDSGSASAFLATGDCAAHTVNTVADSYLASTPIKGKYYSADDYILLTLKSAGTLPATQTGCIKGVVVFSQVQYDGILPTADGLAKTSAPWA